MSSILDHKANFATDGERVPRSKADRIRTMGRIEPRTFSDSTYIFSAADTKRKNRFQKDYVGIGPGDMLAKERRTGKEPPSHQNIKYEDDNVRFLATGERLRQANPSDRIPRMFELSTQRIQRLNVYPDGTPRSGFPADMSQEQLMQTQMGKAITDITTILKQGIPQQRALSEEEYKRLLAEQFQSGGIQSMIFDREQNTRLRNEALANLPANLAAQIEPGLKGLFGPDVKSIEKIAEDVSIKSAEGRLQQLQDIRSSVDFKKNATELAKKLGAKIDIKKDKRDEISEVLSNRLDIIKRIKEDRAKAEQEVLSRRASIDSQISESELKQPESAPQAATMQGAAPQAAAIQGAPLLENKEDAAAVAYELARDNYTLLRNKMKKSGNLTADEEKNLLDSAKYLLLSTSGGPVSTTEAELDKMNLNGLLMVTDYRIGLTSSPKAASPKGPSPKASPKASSPKASPKAVEESKDDPAEVINEMIKNIRDKKASNVDEEANMLGVSKADILDYHESPEKEKELIQKLEEVRDDGLTYLNSLSMYNSLSEDKRKRLPSFIAKFLNVNEDLVSKNLIAGESGIKDIEDAIKSKLDGQIVELFPPTQITTSTVARIDDIFKQISLTGTVSDYRLADSQRYLKATYDYLKDFSAWKGMTKEEAEKAYESFKNRFKEPPIPRSKINGKPLANQTQSAKRYLTIERVFKSAIKNNGELKQKTFYSAFGTVSIPPVS